MKHNLMKKAGLLAALGLLFADSVWAQPSAGGSITFTATPPNPATVPTLSQWGLVLLALGLAFVTWRALKRSRHGSRIVSVLMASATVGLVLGAVFCAREAYSSYGIDAQVDLGLPQDLYAGNDIPVWNAGSQDLYVLSIQANPGNSLAQPVSTPACQVGRRIPANGNSGTAACYVRIAADIPPPPPPP